MEIDATRNAVGEEENAVTPFPVDGNDRFLRFLRHALAIRDKEWPTARTLDDALQRYQAAEAAIAKLKAWGWSRPQGGFQVPRCDPRDHDNSE